MKSQAYAQALGARSEPYWLALGQFIDSFVAVEIGMQEILAIEAGVSATTAKAVFQGLQIDRVHETLKRIWASNNHEPPEFLTRALAQLILINGARNDILHRGAKFDGKHWLVATKSNVNVVRVVTAETLDAMTTDTLTIRMAFAAHAMEFGVGRTQEIRSQFLEAVAKKWRFEPVIKERKQSDGPSGPRRDQK